MNLYRHLDAEYRHIARRRLPAAWSVDGLTADDLVAGIRAHRPDPGRSDELLRPLVIAARNGDRHATIVVAHALAPLLQVRLGRTSTVEYRDDALSELTIVILDSPVDGTRLAARMVNRAHTRVHKAARRVQRRGTVHVVEITPTDPDRLAAQRSDHGDIADDVAARVDLERFHRAVDVAIADGVLSISLWSAFRDHRLLRPVDGGRASTGIERKLASRAVPKVQPLVVHHLHAA